MKKILGSIADKLLNKLEPVNSVSSLQTKSANVFNVFTSTVNQLNDINKQIQHEMDERNSQMNKLRLEHDTLNSTMTSNSLMIGKISSFLKE